MATMIAMAAMAVVTKKLQGFYCDGRLASADYLLRDMRLI
jgi:hypothetical protein